MWQWSADSGPVKLADVPLGAVTPTRLYGDDAVRRIFWVASAVMEFGLEQNARRIWWSTSFPTGGSAIDSTYLYWTRTAPSFGTIERMRLNTP